MDLGKGKPTSTCTNCKKRKVKCDRRVPCGACIKIKSGFSCHYETKWKSISFNGGEGDSSDVVHNNNNLNNNFNNKNNNNNDNHDPAYANELTILKSRLKELESSLESLASHKQSAGDTKNSVGPAPRCSSVSASGAAYTPTKTIGEGSTSLLGAIDYSYVSNPYLLNPRDEDAAVINFYEGYTSIQVRSANRRHNLGPLTWSCTMRKDPWINMIYDIITPARGKLELLLGRNPPTISKKNTTLLTTHDDDDPRNEKTFERIQLETEGYDEVVPLKDIGAKSSNKKGSHREVTSGVASGVSGGASGGASGEAPGGASGEAPEGAAGGAAGGNGLDETREREGHNTDGPRTKKPKVLNVTSITLAKTLFDGRFDPELRLVEQIQTILPVKRVIWSLIGRFFKVLYPFYPFLDEIDFRSRLSAIIGAESFEEEKVKELKIEYRLDLALMATLLVVLRLTYLSLFSNRDCNNSYIMNCTPTDPEEEEKKYLLSNPINVVAIKVAHACLCCFQISVRTNLTVFQATLLLRLYRTLGPEEGDRFDGGELQFSTAMLVQMGYSLGLHREPDNFPDLRIDERTNHLTRKLWYFLILSDLLNAFNSGNPTLIDVKHYDTKEPVATRTNSSLDDFALEESAVDTLKWLDVSLSSIGKILDVIVDIRKYSSINYLTEALNNIEQVLRLDFQVSRRVPRFDTEQTSSTTKYTDVIKTKVFLTLYCSLITIYVHLYLYYERQSKFDYSFFYLKKLLYIIQELIVPLIFEVLLGRFNESGLILNPILLLAIHKCNQVILSCYARVNYVKYAKEKNKNHQKNMDNNLQYRQSYEKYRGLSSKLEAVGSLILSIILKLSSRYYYAWRIQKAHRILFKNYSGTLLYQKVTKTAKTLHSFQFTSTQLEEFDSILNTLMQWLKYIDGYRDNHTKLPRFIDENYDYEFAERKYPEADASTSSLRSEDSCATDPAYVDQMWMSMLAMKNNPSTMPQSQTHTQTQAQAQGLYTQPNANTSEVNVSGERQLPPRSHWSDMPDVYSNPTPKFPSIPSLDQWVGTQYMPTSNHNQVPERPMYTTPYHSITGTNVLNGDSTEEVGAIKDLLSEDIESFF